MPLVRVFRLDADSLYPGWYFQRYVDGELVTRLVPVHAAASPDTAAGVTATMVGCIPEQVQVAGPSWPAHQVTH